MSAVHRYDRVGSTQDVARDLARGGAPHGTTVLAEVQDAGRGRLDRRWDGGRGLDLTFSVVLRPGGRMREAPLLTLGAAAEMARALDVRVKWPNDLVDDSGRKLAGVLAEVEAAEGDRVAWVVLGVGLNVNRTVFPGLPNATSLAVLRGAALDREATFQRVLAAILAGTEAPGRLDVWRERAHTLGRHVRIGAVEGVADALRDDGALIVGGVAVTTGEIGL